MISRVEDLFMHTGGHRICGAKRDEFRQSEALDTIYRRVNLVHMSGQISGAEYWCKGGGESNEILESRLRGRSSTFMHGRKKGRWTVLQSVEREGIQPHRQGSVSHSSVADLTFEYKSQGSSLSPCC